MNQLFFNSIMSVMFLPAGKEVSRKRILLFLLLIVSIMISCGEDDLEDENETTPVSELSVTFSKIYGGSHDDTFHDVIATADGGLSLIHI